MLERLAKEEHGAYARMEALKQELELRAPTHLFTGELSSRTHFSIVAGIYVRRRTLQN